MAERDPAIEMIVAAIPLINDLIDRKDARIRMLEALLDDAIDSEVDLKHMVEEATGVPVL